MNTPQASVWGRMVAATQGEVSTTILEAYRRAGNTIHDQLHTAESKRLVRRISGETPWTISKSEQLELLYTWNAHVLQVLGDKFLDADYSAQPVTAGFVPKVTYDQVESFYAQVEGWLSRARQAATNPHYRPDLYLPASLPAWAEVEPCPRPHLDGMMAAIRHVRTHAEAAMKVFEDDGTPPNKQEVLSYLRQLFAEANTKSDYVEGLWQPKAPLELHERIEEQGKVAIAGYYRLGQLLAMPSLAEEALQLNKDRSKSHQRTTRRLSKQNPLWPLPPGEPGFDAWVMTDPAHRDRLKRDARVKQAIENMWKYAPNPRKTLGLFAEIEAARERGDVDYAKNPDGTNFGFYMCTPYAAIYETKRPVTLQGRFLGTAQRFSFEASPEAVLLGKPFEFGLLVSDFRHTDIDYCEIDKPSVHDDE